MLTTEILETTLVLPSLATVMSKFERASQVSAC